MEKHFIIYPGYVRSKYDGQIHYINASMLVNLYRVAPGEYVVDCYPGLHPPDLIALGPRYDGDYEEYLAKQLEKAKEK